MKQGDQVSWEMQAIDQTTGLPRRKAGVIHSIQDGEAEITMAGGLTVLKPLGELQLEKSK